MEDMQNQMNAILGNPEVMQKIMAMAQSLGQSKGNDQQSALPKQESNDFSMPNIDLSMVQKLAGLAGQSSIDADQRNLIGALRPYLSASRLSKLERAMRAAKMASMAGILTGKSPLGR